MHVIELHKNQTGRQSFRAGLVRMLENVGTSEFDSILADIASEALNCDQVTAFEFPNGLPPRIITIAGRNHRHAAEHAALRYMDTHWKRDPTNLFREQELTHHQNCVVFMSEEEVADSSYRYDCYTSTGIGHRLSIIKPYKGEYLKMSFHRNRKAGKFPTDSLEELFDQSDLLFQLLLKHNRSSQACRHGDDAVAHYDQCLARQYPELSKRERQVCSLIVYGLTSEAIALSLDISLNTVLTYRRRAYSRLNISTQNELLRIVL